MRMRTNENVCLPQVAWRIPHPLDPFLMVDYSAAKTAVTVPIMAAWELLSRRKHSEYVSLLYVGILFE